MIKKYTKFNEELFGRVKNTEEVKPMGFRTTVTRPEQPVNRLSDDDIEIMKKEMEKSSMDRNRKVDPYFIQEITDRILGPDSEAYISELTELNKKYRTRLGKTGLDVFKD